MRISYGKLRVPVHRIAGDDVLACEVDVEVLGDNFAPAYTEQSADLSAYAGKTIRLRFHVDSNDPPHPCTRTTAVIRVNVPGHATAGRHDP